MSAASEQALKNIRVNVVLDSTVEKTRVTTVKVRLPRFLLPELSTHDLISKSTESSRAVPVKTKIKQLETQYWIPEFRSNKRGMQAGDTLDDVMLLGAEELYNGAKHSTLDACSVLDEHFKIHKQYVNRLLEPFSYVNTVLTATEWDNFFALRAHPDADPAFEFLAKAIYLAIKKSVPTDKTTSLVADEFYSCHLPFIDNNDIEVAKRLVKDFYPEHHLPVAFPGSEVQWHLFRWSAVRCARVSYKMFDGTSPNPETEDKTWASLMGYDRDNVEEVMMSAVGYNKRKVNSYPYNPIHASPAKHQCFGRDFFLFKKEKELTSRGYSCDEDFRSNLFKVIQFRKLLPFEQVTQFSIPDDVYTKWTAEIPEEVFSNNWD